jgi:hypothetical protein
MKIEVLGPGCTKCKQLEKDVYNLEPYKTDLGNLRNGEIDIQCNKYQI